MEELERDYLEDKRNRKAIKKHLRDKNYKKSLLRKMETKLEKYHPQIHRPNDYLVHQSIILVMPFFERIFFQFSD